MKKKVIFVCSTGGHLSEMMRIKELFSEYDSLFVTEKDSTTKKLQLNIPIKYLTYGSRKQIFSYSYKFGYNCLKSFFIFISFKPEYIVTTGAHTAIPLCYLANWFNKKIVYVESIARVNSKSMAGKMLENKADLFIVQWEDMLRVYPHAEYHGQIL